MDKPVQKRLLTVNCQICFTCWHATELQVWWLLVFPYFLSHDWSGTRVQVQRKAAELWTHRPQSFCPPLPLICVRLMMTSRMNSMLFSAAHTPIQSLRVRYESLFSEAGAQDAATFLHQNNNTLFFHINWLFFMSRLAVARFDWRPFLVNLETLDSLVIKVRVNCLNLELITPELFHLAFPSLINPAESGCGLKHDVVGKEGLNSRNACNALACTGERW